MADIDNSGAAAEARWRYQHLVWTQQQIQLQIQQQQQHLHHPSHHQQQHHQHPQQHPQEQEQQQQQQQHIPSPKMSGVGMEGNAGGGGIGGAPINTNMSQGLQPVPMSEKSLEEKQAKGDADPWDNFDVQAAFLGPTLWDKRLPYDGQDLKLECVDLEEFLADHGIPYDSQQNGQGPSSNGSSDGSLGGPGPAPSNGGDQMGSADCSPVSVGGVPPHMLGDYGPGPSQGHMSQQQDLMRGPPSSLAHSENSRSPSPCGSSISRSSDDSTEGEHPHHLVGHPRGPNFDPRTRIFSEEELKPQPMIKKSKKQFVPVEQKDAKYWARRRKNNMAAKRSRDARRVKENQIAMRACFLEKENAILKQEIDRVQKENLMLKEQLGCGVRRDN